MRKLEEAKVDILAACNKCCLLNIQTNGMNGVCVDCNKAIQRVIRFHSANIPCGYWSISMEKDFIGFAPLMTKYNELVGDLPKMMKEGRSLLLCGQHGVGKTLMATSLLKKMVLKGYDGIYTTLGDAVSALTGSEYNEQFVVRKQLQMVSGLVIDEFDNRFVSSDKSSDLFARSLENIVRARLANKLTTVIISNSPNIIETLSGDLKSSLGSLFALLEKVVVLGNDARKEVK
jgi:DNA replication protein DnaC